MSFRLLGTFFFFNDTATTEIYTLSLHDALPIFARRDLREHLSQRGLRHLPPRGEDRKSTRLNSSHEWNSYAVFCLKKQRRSSAGNGRTSRNTRTVRNMTDVSCS